MTTIEKNEFTGWEVSIMKIKEDKTVKYKVTRRLPEMNVAETKVFITKKDAMTQFEDWLHDF